MKNHGGKRKGVGRKPAFEEETTTIAFRIPVSKEKEIRKLVNEYLKQFRK